MEEISYYEIREDDGKGDKSLFIRHLNKLENSDLDWQQKFNMLRGIAEEANISNKDLRQSSTIIFKRLDRIRDYVMSTTEVRLSKIKDFILNDIE